MPATKTRTHIRKRRARRTRSVVQGTSQRPRLSVFRSARFTYAQLIDDLSGKTLAAASTKERKKKTKTKVTKVEEAYSLGEAITKKAKDAGVAQAVFDKGSYRYHGRVKAVAEGARKAGLKL